MKLRVTVQGKTYEVDVEVLESNGGSAVQQAPAPAPAAPAPAQQPAAPQPAPAPSHPAPAQDKSSQPEATAAAGDNVFPAPLAGTVRTIHVKPGDTVEANQEMMVVEAMKMETNVSAPGAGKIKSVLVNVGDAVSAGQPLVEFE